MANNGIFPNLPRWTHLAVDGSSGGTTFALQLARESIEAGNRVLWASEEMPNPLRFNQLFNSLNIIFYKK